MVELTSVVMMAVVTLSNEGRAVGGGTGAEPDIRMTKLPIPIQKAMTRPATKPTTAPWGGKTGEFWLQHHSPQPDLTCWHACRCYYINVLTFWAKRQMERDKMFHPTGLTVELAQGKNMPRQKRPSRGPPTIPKMLKAAWENRGESMAQLCNNKPCWARVIGFLPAAQIPSERQCRPSPGTPDHRPKLRTKSDQERIQVHVCLFVQRLYMLDMFLPNKCLLYQVPWTVA